MSSMQVPLRRRANSSKYVCRGSNPENWEGMRIRRKRMQCNKFGKRGSSTSQGNLWIVRSTLLSQVNEWLINDAIPFPSGVTFNLCKFLGLDTCEYTGHTGNIDVFIEHFKSVHSTEPTKPWAGASIPLKDFFDTESPPEQPKILFKFFKVDGCGTPSFLFLVCKVLENCADWICLDLGFPRPTPIKLELSATYIKVQNAVKD